MFTTVKTPKTIEIGDWNIVEAWKTPFKARWYSTGPLLVGYYTELNEEGVYDGLVHIKWEDGDMTHDVISSQSVLNWYKLGIGHKPEEGEIERIKNIEVADHWDHWQSCNPKKRVRSDHGKPHKSKKRRSG